MLFNASSSVSAHGVELSPQLVQSPSQASNFFTCSVTAPSASSSTRELQNLVTVRVERTCTLPAEVAVKAI